MVRDAKSPWWQVSAQSRTKTPYHQNLSRQLGSDPVLKGPLKARQSTQKKHRVWPVVARMLVLPARGCLCTTTWGWIAQKCKDPQHDSGRRAAAWPVLERSGCILIRIPIHTGLNAPMLGVDTTSTITTTTTTTTSTLSRTTIVLLLLLLVELL